MPYDQLRPHPFFQAAGATVSGTGAVTVVWPTHLALDIALLICESSSELVTLSTPAGFAQIAAGDALNGLNPSPGEFVAGGTRLTVFWARASSAAMASPVVADPGDHIVAKILTFRNCVDSGSPFSGFNFTASRIAGTSFQATGCPCDAENSIIIGVATTSNTGVSSAIFSNFDSSSLLGGGTMTEIADSRVADGNGGGFGVAWGYLGPTGATGSITYTVSGSGFSARASILLKPNPAPALAVTDPRRRNKGHKLDANTLLLWTMDETNEDTRFGGEYESITNTAMGTAASSGIPGLVDYSPIPGKYAALFMASPHAATSGLAYDAALATIDGGTAAVTIGSWTWEFFFRPDTLALAQNILGVQGATSETAANNFLGRATLLTNGYWQMFWESGLGTDHTIQQTVGTPLVVGTWYHIAIVKDSVAKTVAYYTDGVLQDTVSYATNPDTGTSCVQLVGKNGTTANSGNFGSFALRQWHFSRVIRSGAYIAANAALKTTTATMIPDDSTHQLHQIGSSGFPPVRDSSGNQLHGFSEGSSTTVNISRPSGIGGLIRDGGRARTVVNCDIRTIYNAAINAALIDTFTVEMWILANLPAALANIGQGFFCHGDPGDESQAGNYIAAGATGGDWTVFLDAEHDAGSNSQSLTQSAPGIFNYGTLHHIAVRGRRYGTVYGDGGSTRMEVQIFMDGVQVHTGDILKPNGSNNNNISFFKVNHKNQGASEGNSIIDDVRVSNIRRSDAEIAESYQRGAGLVGPVISTLSPSPGAIVTTQAITFSVTDADGGLDFVTPGTFPTITIEALYGSDSALGGIVTETVFANGSFGGGFDGGGSTATPVTNGVSFTVLRDGNWPSTYLGLFITAVDIHGNVTTTNSTYSTNYVAPTPVINAITPSSPALIATSQAVGVNVTSPGGSLGQVIISVEYGSDFPGSSKELVLYDGAFQPGFTPSSRTTITNGFTFALVASGGWASATLTFTVRAISIFGVVVTQTFSYTTPYVNVTLGDGAGPVISGLTPANGTELARAATISFAMADIDGIKDTIITCLLDGEADPILIYDSAGFHGRWLSRSTVVDTITLGKVVNKAFVIAPAGGWYKRPTAFKVNGYDLFGRKEGVDL